MSRVLIANMPFSSLRWPNIGPSLLKAALARRGIGCDIAYLNFDFAERVGLNAYTWIADSFAFVLGGERLFAKHHFGERLPDDETYWRDILTTTDAGLTERDRIDFEAMFRQIEPFLDTCIERIDWSQYAVVGFAASFQQTMASVCLARRIKELHPKMVVVFGGAACEGTMGLELAKRFDEMDYVFLGEADLTFVPVVEQVMAGGEVVLPRGVVGGGHCLQASSGTEEGSGTLVEDLDGLPYPDFDDYFARWCTSSLKQEVEPLLFFETSRGCWWGQKHHCLFCGLNGGTLAYRSKTPKRAVDELAYLVDRYDTHRACSADNILDRDYFETFLPMLRDSGIDLKFVFEMKTNMTRRQVETLLSAGLGAAQLGIETFITPLLRHIGKGATAIHNLQTLKWFSEPGIEVKWNLLYGFPGETPGWYDELAELIPSLVHLAPPLAVGRVRLDRFSPYFEAPEQHGMANPRPNRAFAHVYPFAEESLRRIAYYYEYDYADGRNPLDHAAGVLEAIERWQQLAETVTLRQFDREDGLLLLTDTRPEAVVMQRRLTGWQRQLYLFCDSGQTIESIQRHLPDIDESAIRRFLTDLCHDHLTARIDGRYLSLALRSR